MTQVVRTLHHNKFIPHKYQGWWWFDDAKSQVISNFDIDLSVLLANQKRLYIIVACWQQFWGRKFTVTLQWRHNGHDASQITSLTIVCSTGYSGADQRKHQSSASLAFVRGIHRCPVNSPHKGPVTRKMFPFDDVIMNANHRTDPQSAPNSI